MEDNEASQEKIIVVSSDEVEFIENKVTLVKESDYFRALNDSGMKDSSASRISLPCLDSSGLGFIFESLRGKPPELSLDMIHDVLNASSYLQIERITSTCSKFLAMSLAVDNFLIIRDITECFHLDELRLLVDSYICDNFRDIIEGDIFSDIPHDLLLQFCKEDRLNIETEFALFQAVVKWIKKSEDLEYDFSDLVKSVRYPLMTETQLAQCKASLQPLSLEGTQHILKLLDLALIHVNNPTKTEIDNENSAYRARYTSQVLLSLGGFTQSDQSTNRMMVLPIEDLVHDEIVAWRIRPPSKAGLRLPRALCEHCVVCWGCFVFVAGGQSRYCQDGRHTQENVYRLDTRNGTWTEVTSMIIPRSLFYMGLLDDRMFAVGGWIGPDRVSRSVETYDFHNDKWQTVAGLEIGLHEHAGTAHDGRLYVSGGFKGPYRGHLDRVWCYNPLLDSWEEKSNMTRSRSYHCMVSTGSHIFVAGGVNYIGNDTFEDVFDCEEYDVKTDQWTIINQIPRFASCMSTCLLGNSLYVFGGHSFAEGRDHNELLIYDFTTKQWTIKDMLARSSKFYSNAVVSLPKKIIESFRIA